MSEPAKKPHIEVKIGGKKPKLYLVPREKAKGLEKLLADFLLAPEVGIPADEVFAELDEKYSKVGNTIAGFRLRDQWTQAQLAKKIGTSQPAIAAIETGKRKVGKTMAQKLAKAFKTDFKVFLTP